MTPVCYTFKVPFAVIYFYTYSLFSSLTCYTYWYALHMDTSNIFTPVEKHKFKLIHWVLIQSQKKCNCVPHPLIFSRNRYVLTVVYNRATWCISIPNPKQQKKPTWKKFLIFLEMELFGPNIKKILIFYYISKNATF